MIVIMAGLPGTGKSTLAQALAQRLPGAVLDKDAIRAALFEPAHVHRDRRLGLIDPLRGAGERAEVDDGEKRSELVGVEHFNPSKFVINYSTNIRLTDQWPRRIICP